MSLQDAISSPDLYLHLQRPQILHAEGKFPTYSFYLVWPLDYMASKLR